jgi:hypothetical protein
MLAYCGESLWRFTPRIGLILANIKYKDEWRMRRYRHAADVGRCCRRGLPPSRPVSLRSLASKSQNSSSRLMLVFFPAIVIERLTIADFMMPIPGGKSPAVLSRLRRHRLARRGIHVLRRPRTVWS